MATLSGNKIKDTYQSLIKLTDNGNLTTGAKRITDGFGNNSPLFLSTTQIGVGVTPTVQFHASGDGKFGGNLTVTGNLVVEGSLTTVGTDTLTVKDPLIVLANNNTSSDAVDIGFYGKYHPSSTTLFAGLFRDESDDKFKLFKSLQVEPTTTVNTSGTGYATATLVADVEGTLTGVIASTTTATTQSANNNSTKVATTAYVDNSAGNYLPLAGGTMSGNIAMGSNNISGGGTFTATTFSGQLSGTISSATTATTQSQGDDSTKVATTAYVDAAVTAEDLDIIGDSGTGSVDLDSQTFTIAGGTNVTTSVSNQTVTINATGAVDGSGTANDVVMWQDSDTLTDAPIAISGNNATFAGDVTLESSTSTKPHLTIKNTNADNSSPQLRFIKDSVSPADNDETGRIYMYGDNDAGEQIETFLARTIFTDVSDGSEDSTFEMFTYKAGTQTSTLTLASGDATFAGNVLLNGYLSVEGTSGNTGAASDRWIGGDGTAGTWFYNVPTGSQHLFGINNSNVLTLNATGATFAGSITGTSAQFIDTSNPDGGSGAGEGGSVIIEGRRDGTANLLSLRSRDASAPTVALPNGQGGILRFQGFDGTDFAQMGGIQVVADGQAVANGDAPSKMNFYTVPDGTETLTVALALDKSQNATFAGAVAVNGGDLDVTAGNLTVKTSDNSSSVILQLKNSDNNGYTFLRSHTTGFLEIDGNQTGANGYVFKTDSTAALTIANNANATFAGTISSGAITSSASITASGNSNNFGNTTIAALSATSGTFSASVTAAGNSNSFGATTFTGAVTGTSFSATGGFLNGSNGGIRIHISGTKFFNVTAANAARDNIMDIGASDARFKDLFLGGNITIGGGHSFANDGNGDLEISSGSSDNMIIISNGTLSIRTGGNNERLGFNSAGAATFAGQIIASDSIKFTGNVSTPTGNTIFRPANNTLAFGTASTERMRISSSGNVGINETAPGTLLALGGAKNTSIITLKSTTNDSSWSSGDVIGGINFHSEDGSGAGAGVKGSISYIATSSSGGSTGLSFKTSDSSNNNVERMFINNTGVGIGNTSPSTKLDIGGMADPVLRIKSDAGGDPELRFDAAAANRSARIKFYDNGSVVGGFIDYLHNGDKMNFGCGSSTGVTMSVGDGVVGIGTTVPSSDLHILGISNDTVSQANANLNVEGQGGNGIVVGTIASAPYSTYIQSGFVDNFSTAVYPISLNPLGGNVGIGTTSPNDKLHIVGNLFIEDGSPEITFETGSSHYNWQIAAQENVNAALEFSVGSQDADASNDTFTPKMIILQNGNVGIGTTAPAAKLEIFGTGNTLRLDSAANQSKSILFRNVGSGTAEIKTDGDLKLNAEDSGKTIQFFTEDTIRMKLDSAGTLTVSDDLVAFGSPSDKRLKENIKPIESALDKVSKLEGVTFDWKKSDSILDIKKDIGFIAQDVQKVVPELVRENDNGMLSIRHQGMTPILLEAIKELKAEIEELKKQIK